MAHVPLSTAEGSGIGAVSDAGTHKRRTQAQAAEALAVALGHAQLHHQAILACLAVFLLAHAAHLALQQVHDAQRERAAGEGHEAALDATCAERLGADSDQVVHAIVGLRRLAADEAGFGVQSQPRGQRHRLHREGHAGLQRALLRRVDLHGRGQKDVLTRDEGQLGQQRSVVRVARAHHVSQPDDRRAAGCHRERVSRWHRHDGGQRG
mmetsp:Transcript_98023/g.253490  ORF Transcript_98023/g.253490 Transcript_98023/m.253490 type:complete len:209 (+) Transcript_98023:233-859(+)